jgi:hypothetical protein
MITPDRTTTTARRWLFWSPRILTILFAVFLSLFALDVFGEGNGFWKTAVALAMHLVPTLAVLIVLAISWHHEWAGAILFTGLGIWYVLSAWGRFPLSVYFVVAGPLFLVGILFLVDWQMRAGTRTVQ